MARKSTEKESLKEAKMVGKTGIGANQDKTGTAKAKASGKPNGKNGGAQPEAQKTKNKAARGVTGPKPDDKDPVDKKTIHALIEKGQKQGYLSYDEINKALPEDMFSTEQMDDTLILFDKMNVKIVDEEKAEYFDGQKESRGKSG